MIKKNIYEYINMATQGSTQGPTQSPEPEWKRLINQLASLGNFNDNFKQGVDSMQQILRDNVSTMQNVNTILGNLKERVSGTLIETTKIIEALKTGSDVQKSKLDQLESFRSQLVADITNLDDQIKIAKTNTNELQSSLGESQTTSGGKRRRRTRNKKRKYHKKTKRGGYKYGNQKEKQKRKNNLN